jgi:hypothetical protein
MLLCEFFSFSPIKGQVALNPIPKNFQLKLKKDPAFLTILKNGVKGSFSDKSQDKFWTFPQFVPRDNT